MVGLEVAVKMLLSVASQPVVDILKRQERVVSLLKKLKLTPKIPPRDFESLYVYTLVEFCYGKPEPIINFFRNELIREAFRVSFESGDPRYLDREAEEVIAWNHETEGIGFLDYNFRLEFAGFTAVFNALVDRSRGAAEARTERKIDDLQMQLATLRKQLSEQRSIETIREIATTPASGQQDPVSWLAAEAKGWFEAVEYPFEKYENPSDQNFEWVIKVPVRRGRYDRVVVYGRAGEATVADVIFANDLLAKYDADEAWILVPRRVSTAAREVCDSRVACYTLDELLDQDAEFDGYLDWLDREVKRRHIDTGYVPLSCAKDEYDGTADKPQARSIYDESSGGLIGYVEGWLSDSSKEHLSILGEFGTGKSWFCLRIAWELANRYRSAKAQGRPRPRLPLLVPLRDYAKAVSVESLFSEFFFRKHQVQLANYKVFEYLNRSGRLLLIFDGFDEMASRVDRQARINNFWELAKVVLPGAKVLLTCRTEHFPEAKESRDLLSAQLRASTQALTGTPPQFEVVEVLPFGDAQIKQLLGYIATKEVALLILDHPVLMDLMRRPVMSELVIDALPEISSGSRIDMSRVYLYAVRRKISRDIQSERTFTSLEDKVFFLCELSWEMLSTHEMSLNYREFPERIRTCFGSVVKEQKDLDHWHHDMLGQSMLIRNSDGDYAPAHRSLLEFFVAYKFAAELGILNDDFHPLIDRGEGETFVGAWSEYFHREDRFQHPSRISKFEQEAPDLLAKTFGSQVLANAVSVLLLPMLDQGVAKEKLLSLARSTRGMSSEQAQYLGGNAVTLLTDLDRNSLRGEDLSFVNLSGAVLDKRDGTAVDCSTTNFSNSIATEVDFENVVLTGANVVDVNLSTARFVGWGAEYPEAMASRSGLLAAATHGGGVKFWKPEALVGGSMFSPPIGRSPNLLESPINIEVLIGCRYLCMLGLGGIKVLDLPSGKLIFEAQDRNGYLPVYGRDYVGILHCSSFGHSRDWKLNNLQGESFIGEFSLGAGWKLDFFDPVARATMVLSHDTTISSVTVGQDGIQLTPVAELESGAIGEFHGQVFCSGGHLIHIYTDMSARRRREVVELSSLQGSLIGSFCMDDLPDVDSGEGLNRLHGASAAYCASAGVVAILKRSDLFGVGLADGQVRWRMRGMAGLTAIEAVDGTEYFAVANRYGEVSIRSMRTSELIDRISMNQTNLGLRVSANCELSSSVLDCLEFVGAVIVDGEDK